MIIPRAKIELTSEIECKFVTPISIQTDNESTFVTGVIQEMLPYIKTANGEGGSVLSIQIQSEISEKNEFYKLVSKGGNIEIIAKDKRGVVNAVASLAQIIYENNGEYYVNETRIEDYPDKEFRSLMIDTGRKYIPLDELRAQILMMAKAKMTKLHWHITDSEGCPVRFDTIPNIKSPDPDGRKYTKDDVRSIVEYAGIFMIDVIPEIDMPGHSFELVNCMPDIACKADHIEGWDFCIGNEKSYEYVENILKELTEIFPYEYYHIGTDEINMRDIVTKHGAQIQDWENCTICNEKFSALGLHTITERLYYFVKRVYNILKKLGKKMIMWNDNIDISKSPDIPRDILIEFWRVAGMHRGPSEGCSMQRFLEEGFTVVNADYPNTYIDLPEYLNWKKLRTWNLTTDPTVPEEYADKIIGAESCAWDIQRHYAFSLYTTVPAFADRAYNLSSIADDGEFGAALTRIALGASVPKGFNMFDCVLRDFILSDNSCNIFKSTADKDYFKRLLSSLGAMSKDQEKLISAYIELL